MANLQYIGARYVPKFYFNPDDNSNDWKSGVLYEALTIVTYNNDSYTSKITVPESVGNPADNPQFWACTTKYTAALVALQNSVGAIENEIGDNELITIEQTLTGAINELALDREFESYRYGSFKSTSQGCTYANNKFYFARTSGGNLVVDVYDDDLTNINSYTYPYAIHPNAIFVVDNILYIVDSTNRDLLSIKLSDMSFIGINTAFESYLIASGYYSDGFIYLYGNNKVLVLTKTLSVVRVIDVPVPDHMHNSVSQGIFVYENIIYRVWNQPNALSMYNLDGVLIGVKNMGEGSGFYPYGEVETFFERKGQICFNTVYWSLTPQASPWITNIFVSNLISPVLNDSRYGQRSPEHATIYCGTRTSKNPTGENTNPFDSLYEASLVINYLSMKYAYPICINIADDIFSSDSFVINGGNIDISPASRNIGEIYAYNCNIRLNQLIINKLDARYSDVSLNRCRFSDLLLTNCAVFFGASRISTSYVGVNVTSNDGIVRCSAPKADVTSTGGYFANMAMYTNDPLGTAVPLDTLIEKVIFDSLSGTTSVISTSVIMTGSDFTGNLIPIEINLSTGNKTSYNNGNVVTIHKKYFLQNNSSVNGVLEFDFILDPNAGFSISNATFTGLDGTALTAPTNFYNVDLIRFRNRQS